MKKVFFILCGLFALTIQQLSAQQKQELTLGGNANNSSLSVMQIVDYPILKTTDKDVHVNGFQLVISSQDGQKNMGPFISSNAKFSPEMITALEAFKGMKSKIKLEHIMLFKSEKLLKEESLEYTVEQ